MTASPARTHDETVPPPPRPRRPGRGREARRLAALHRYRILDTPEEEPFDRLAVLARELLGTPIALVSLVDETRRLAAEGGPLRREYRVADLHGAIAWVEASGAVETGGAGRPGGWSARGVLLDVTERRRAEERQALLTRELDHRAKNALAVVQAALRLTPADDPRAYAAAVEGRVNALARAHSLLAASRWEGAELRALAEGELRPFLGATGDGGPGATLSGPPVVLAAHATQPLSMALHELATNAAKHGALSRPGGRLALDWRLEEPPRGREDEGPLLRVTWTERGGPTLDAGAPARRGFGTRLLEGTVRGQLGGRILLRWDPEGLTCELEIPGRRTVVAPAAAGAPRPPPPAARQG